MTRDALISAMRTYDLIDNDMWRALAPSKNK